MKLKIQKLLLCFLVIILVFPNINIIAKSGENYNSTDIDNLTYKQETIIPIDTINENAKFQPVDISVKFDNPCWAKDETHHSVRVAFDDGSDLNEIESQIYSLEFKDDTSISMCNLVFLIPEEANGKEKYYVLYDSKETNPTNYEDHVVLEDTHYFYEPIPGQKIDCDYYGIWDDGNVIYGVVQTGELLGNPISQGVLKFKPGSKKVETYNIDQLGVFDMRYGTIAEPGYIGTSWATSVKKSVLVDGNLMTRVRLEGLSPSGDIKSDNIFTYYHSPIEKRMIFVDVNHEVLKDINVEEPSILDGTYSGIVSIKSRSASIEKMNVGEILPEIHLYNEEDGIDEYSVPQNPSSVEREIILSTQNDIDLGKKAWVCLNNPSTGKAHGIILDSNSGLTEEDGAQVKAWVKENIKLPGLEADTGNLYVARNSYESGGQHNKNLKKGFNVNYKAVFITLIEDGFQGIDKQSEIYQELIQVFPVIRENVTIDEEEVERYSLKCFVHLAPSIPMGSLLSTATGKKIPYIYAELYKDNSFRSSGTVGRLALGSMDIDLEGKKLLEKIKTVFGIFDIRNSSLFKKIVFPDLDVGTYVVKIFRENRFFDKERLYIGYAIVQVEKDTTIRVFCKPEAKTMFTITDQNSNGIPNVKYQLLYNDAVISDGVTDKNGTIILKAPSQPTKPYKLRVLYKGFLLEEKEVKLRLWNRIKTYTEGMSIELHDIKLKIKDTWGFSPAVDVSPKITSNEMFEPTSISSEKIDLGEYVFKDLISADYVVNLRYKSFDIEEKAKINSDKTLNLLFPAEYTVFLDIKNMLGNRLDEKGDIVVSRSSKSISVEIGENSEGNFKVPPGEYTVSIKSDGKTITSQKIDVKGDKSLEIVTNKGSFLHNFMIIIGAIIIILSVVYMFWKKKIYNGLKLAVIGLIVISVFSPWWVLDGQKNNITTNTNTLLYPSNMVTFTSSNSVMGGSVSVLPEEFTMVLQLLSLLLVVVILISLITIFIKEKFRKTSTVLSILSIIFLILCIGLFYYAMSQVTDIGVGSFMGSGEVSTTIPGESEGQILSSNWGPGLGFISSVICLVLLLLLLFEKKISRLTKRKKQNKKH